MDTDRIERDINDNYDNHTIELFINSEIQNRRNGKHTTMESKLAEVPRGGPTTQKAPAASNKVSTVSPQQKIETSMVKFGERGAVAARLNKSTSVPPAVASNNHTTTAQKKPTVANQTHGKRPAPPQNGKQTPRNVRVRYFGPDQAQELEGADDEEDEEDSDYMAPDSDLDNGETEDLGDHDTEDEHNDDEDDYGSSCEDEDEETFAKIIQADVDLDEVKAWFSKPMAPYTRKRLEDLFCDEYLPNMAAQSLNIRFIQLLRVHATQKDDEQAGRIVKLIEMMDNQHRVLLQRTKRVATSRSESQVMIFNDLTAAVSYSEDTHQPPEPAATGTPATKGKDSVVCAFSGINGPRTNMVKVTAQSNVQGAKSWTYNIHNDSIKYPRAYFFLSNLTKIIDAHTVEWRTSYELPPGEHGLPIEDLISAMMDTNIPTNLSRRYATSVSDLLAYVHSSVPGRDSGSGTSSGATGGASSGRKRS